MTMAERYLFKMLNEAAFQERERPMRDWRELQEAEHQARLEEEERPKREAAERAHKAHMEEKARRFEAFLPEYEELCRKHGVTVVPSGYDGEVGLWMVDNPEVLTGHFEEIRADILADDEL